MKSYTDLEQSRTLSEFLSNESADMEYMYLKRDNSMVSRVPFVKDGNAEPDCSYIFIPCWSLAALLEVLPKTIGNFFEKNVILLRIDKGENDFNIWYENFDWGGVAQGLDVIEDNPTDACYEMLLKLNEQKLL